MCRRDARKGRGGRGNKEGDRISGKTGIWRQNVDKKRARETERSLWDLAVVWFTGYFRQVCRKTSAGKSRRETLQGLKKLLKFLAWMMAITSWPTPQPLAWWQVTGSSADYEAAHLYLPLPVNTCRKPSLLPRSVSILPFLPCRSGYLACPRWHGQAPFHCVHSGVPGPSTARLTVGAQLILPN